jgi:excinuclease ABC subunit A
MDVINKLVDKGNTVLIIEHNMDVIKLADYIIDIGYEGGKGGGQLVAKGTPEQVAKDKKPYGTIPEKGIIKNYYLSGLF